MPPDTRPFRPEYQRKAYALQNNYATNNRLQFDFKTHLAIKWIDAWLAEQKGLKAPLSGIVRRAVLRYVDYLQKLEPMQARAEVQGVAWACRGTFTSPEDRAAAVGRLEACNGASLMPFDVVLDGQYVVSQRAAMNRRLDELNYIPTEEGEPNR